MITSEIHINYIAGKYFVWKADDIYNLRAKHRVCGQLVGSIPRKPWQSSVCSTPLILLPCEAHFTVKSGVAKIVDGRDYFAKKQVTQNDVVEFEKKRMLIGKDQIRIFKVEKEGKEKLYHGVHRKVSRKRRREMKWMKGNTFTEVSQMECQVSSSECSISDDLTQLDSKDDDSQEISDFECNVNRSDELKCEKEIAPAGNASEIDSKGDISGSDSKRDTSELNSKDPKEDTTELNSKENNLELDCEECLKLESEVADTEINVKNTAPDVACTKTVSAACDDGSSETQNVETSSVCEKDNTVNTCIAEDTSWKNTTLSEEDCKYYKHCIRVHIPTDSVEDRLFDTFLVKYPMSEREKIESIIYEDIHRRGFFITSALKFGGDFLVYLGDPLRHHSHYIVVVLETDQALTAKEIITYGRLAAAVKKTVVLATVNNDFDINYLSLTWAQMK